MGDDGDNGGQDYGGWSCCNDEQSLFILFYIAFAAISLITLKTYCAKPMRLIAVFLHEMCHAVACWLTCGDVRAIQVYDNEGGVTFYAGGCRCLIIPAGYVGCSFIAMILVILSGGRRTATFAAAVFALALLVSLCYSPNKTMVYLNLSYAIFLITFIIIEWKWITPLLQFVILFFGVFIGIAAIEDIWADTVVRAVHGSDSYACYAEVCPMCMPRCIGVQWIVLAVVFQILGIWLALVQMSNECDDLGWFECIHISIDWQWDIDFDFDGFWDNGP